MRFERSKFIYRPALLPAPKYGLPIHKWRDRTKDSLMSDIINKENETWVVWHSTLTMLNATLDSELAWFQTDLFGISSAIFLAVMTSFLLVISTSYAYPIFFANDTKKIHQLGGFSIVNAWSFFSKRYDFLRSNREKTGHALFSFKVFQVSISLRNHWSLIAVLRFSTK